MDYFVDTMKKSLTDPCVHPLFLSFTRAYDKSKDISNTLYMKKIQELSKVTIILQLRISHC